MRSIAIFSLIALSACTGAGDEREKSVGTIPEVQQFESDSRKNEDGDKEGTGSTASTTTAPANSKSLEQCTAEKRAWRAVVDSGKAPTDCAEPLVDWCCTRKEVLARFPTMATALEARFEQMLDVNKNTLYHCSYDATSKRYKFHAAKIDSNGVTSYAWAYVEEVFPIDTGNKGSCKVVTTNDLKVDADETDVDASPSPAPSASPTP